ncbi:MAG: hypothetical protein WC379_03950 [Methanoregula sp.]|jgi:hypothetical protein
MYENIQAMLVAVAAACVGIVFAQMGPSSIFISYVGMMLIMGAFVIGITGFLLFLRDAVFKYGGSKS